MQKILQVIVRWHLKKGWTYKSFSELSKKTFVEVAEKEFGLKGKASSMTRVSLLTGLTRKDVKSIKELSLLTENQPAEYENKVSRVVYGWLKDKKFKDENGAVAPLSLESDEKGFDELAKCYGGDVHARAILDELVNEGCVEIDEIEAMVRLVREEYPSRTTETDKLNKIGNEIADFLETLDHNLVLKSGSGFLLEKISCDAIGEEYVEKLRVICKDQGQELMRDLKKLLSRHDSSIHPEINAKGKKRIGVGLYYFESDNSDDT